MEHLMDIDTSQNLKPKFAIVGHKGANTVLTYHTIENNRFSSGESLTYKTASNIFKSLKGELQPFKFKGIIPTNLIHFEFNSKLNLTWSVNPSRKHLYFDEKLTSIQSGFYPLPKLIFKLSGTSVNVFAVHRKDVINDELVLYNAPFLNTSTSGLVCMGTASSEYSSFNYFEEIMKFIEKQFFSSVFNATHNSKLIKGNVVNFYKKLATQTTFNDTDLIASKLTLKNTYEIK